MVITETGIILYKGAEPQLFPIDSAKRKNLIKGFATVLKKQGLSDVIPQAYLSKKPVFPIVPVLKIPFITASTLHELKETKENSTTSTTISQIVPKASSSQSSQIVASSPQMIAVTEERKAGAAVSSNGQITLTLEQLSVLMRQQQTQGGLIAPALAPIGTTGIAVSQLQVVLQRKDQETARLE